MPKPLQVKMLGEFTIQEEGSSSVVHANLSGRSRRLWVLIAYLIANRERGVTPQELIDLLWSSAAGDNPMATLQNNVSRARAILQKDGLKDARNLFKYENGVYRWAPDRQTIVDIDTFETKAKELDENVTAENLETAYETCLMYKGDFLAQSSGESWCINLRIYYQSLFTRLCLATVLALLDAGRTREAEALCLRAIDVDPTSEIFSVLLMRSFVMSGNPKRALDHYDYIRRLFEANYSVNVSNELELEKASALQALYGRDLSEQSIRTFLSAGADMRGAFQCNNNVFREIVQLQMREIQRSGQDAQIAAIGFEQSEDDLARQSTNMKRLESTLLDTLRAGDPFTKMSSAQFLVLLPGANHDNAKMVVSRIIERFEKNYPRLMLNFRVFLFDLTSFYDEIIGVISADE